MLAALILAQVVDSITVTATRTETRVADTPASVVVLSADDLRNSAAPAVDDALRQVAGFTLFRRASSRVANPTAQGVTLRGVGASGASRALVLDDGVPLNDPFGGWVYWGRVPMVALERAEVLRGGASDLYGSSAMGGVVQFVRRKTPALNAELSAGSQESGTASVFAAGEHASVAVTAGLLDLLNREELQGVVAHEMAHIRNYDIRTMTVMAALLGAILLLHDWAGRLSRTGAVRVGGRGRGKGGGLFLFLWLLLVLVAPLIGRLLAMTVSRTREFQADATAAELTRNPVGLAGALRKLEGAFSPTRSINRGVAPLCIVDPLGLKAGLREGFWADLFATHPPMAARIARLEGMAYQPSARP